MKESEITERKATSHALKLFHLLHFCTTNLTYWNFGQFLFSTRVLIEIESYNSSSLGFD